VTLLCFTYYFALVVIVQHDPTITVNHSSGLYSMRQSVISDRTSYGVPLTEYYSKVAEASQIFNLRNVQSWDVVDDLCKENFNEMLAVVDSDSLWESLDLLGIQWNFIYKDDQYAVFSCEN
jgi:hypothetical protein